MPPCAALYLVDWLFEIGPVMASGMGCVPLTHGEIEAWQHNTGIGLEQWEARMLKKLSLIYLAETQAAAAADYPAPWLGASYAQSSLHLKAQALKDSIRELTRL